MRSRLLTLVAVLLVLVLGAGCEKPTSYAAKVGGDTISEETLNDWMDVIAASSSLQQAVIGQEVAATALSGAAPNSYAMQYADYVLGILVQGKLVEGEFTKRDLKSDTSTEQAIQQQLIPAVESELKKAKVDVPEGFTQELTDLLVQQPAVIAALGDNVQQWASDQFGRDDIEINAKYGSWSTGGGVNPPTGPLAEPAGS